MCVSSKLLAPNLSYIVGQVYLHMESNVEKRSVNDEMEEGNHDLGDILRTGLTYLNNKC